MDFVEELRWRGMLHDVMPGLEEQLSKEMTTGYAGFDPTADSLHVGNLVPIMMLRHLQLKGHKPIILMGGATGMIGDPSGKSEERNLLSEEVLVHNVTSQQKQVEKYLDFNTAENSAEIVNNYDWFKGITFLDFLRDVGKHITVSYMLAKDSVKTRMESGISFTEFSYQLLQGYDFHWLYHHKNTRLQMGASDQWGNIVTGTELIRRMAGGEAWALTAPLITKADGAKFGKSESGSIWLDPEKTSPYSFYQFWLSASDVDAARYIRIFTFLTKEEIEALELEHDKAPHLRLLQKALAKDITIRVHSEKDFNAAMEASDILFGKGTTETLRALPEKMFLSVFEGVPQYEVGRDKFENGITLVDLLTGETGVFPSKGETRKMLQNGGLSLNKEKVTDTELIVNTSHLLNGRFMLIQKGRTKYFIIKSE